MEVARGLDSLEIVRKGVKAFLKEYGGKRYTGGAGAKLAVYCGTIARLEEEIYPLLVGELNIAPERILKYHQGNKTHAIHKDAAAEFALLDSPLSQKQIVLLVQIGKEGWDCRSLTGVILSQEGDCPRNMVLQTSCRCLRQVDGGAGETALILLNEENGKTILDTDRNPAPDKIDPALLEQHRRELEKTASAMNMPEMAGIMMRQFISSALVLGVVKNAGLEIYYNGERHLTEFRIRCFAKSGRMWRSVGDYTPDFLVIRRDGKKAIRKILIVETKGSGFIDQKAFEDRRTFMKNDFIRLNNEKFGYRKFDFMVLQDSDGMDRNLAELAARIKSFFVED
ncbi:MAG: hypothetical protein R6X19_04535 [Kiritimatiellia bacterium]